MTDLKTLIYVIEQRERIAERDNHAFVDLPYEVVGNVIAMLKELDPVEPELEGGGSTWWHVCGECHGAIDVSDNFCKHCGRRIRHEKKAE